MNTKGIIYFVGAATITILILVYFISPDSSSQTKDISSQYSLSPPIPDSLHFDTISGPEKDALFAYQNKNYGLAKKLFNGLPASDEQRFYLAMAHWELGEGSKAILLWMVQANQPQAQFYQEAQWYLALAYLDRKQFDQAIELLNKILQQPDHPFQKESENLLKELK